MVPFPAGAAPHARSALARRPLTRRWPIRPGHGIHVGWFTATEGAGGAFLFALSLRALTWKVLVEGAHGERRLACIEPDPRDLLNGPPAH